MKNHLRQIVLMVLMMGILTGFDNVVPKTEIPSLVVHHQIKGEHVLFECIVTGISFRESDHSKEKVGKIIVWIDGKINTEVNAAAFIVKGLSPGSHRVKLEVVNLNNVSYGISKDLMVNIPR